MKQSAFLGLLLTIGLVAVASCIMSIIGMTVLSDTTASTCWVQRDYLLAKAASVLSSRDPTALDSVFSADIVFDISASGGPGPIYGLPDLVVLFELLQTIIRSQTTLITNALALNNDCGAADVLVPQYHAVQAMDQVLIVGDLYLPAIVTGGSVTIGLSPSRDRIASFVLAPDVTQLIVSPQFSGVIVPPVKKRSRDPAKDAAMWAMLQEWITFATANGRTQMATMLLNSTCYAILSEIYNK